MRWRLQINTLLSQAAVALGLLFVISGSFHTVSVISDAVKERASYDFRMVSLLTTGGITIYPGLINIIISRWIKQGQLWAFGMSAVVTFPQMIFLAFLGPLHPNFLIGVILNGLYLGLLFVAWKSVRKENF